MKLLVNDLRRENIFSHDLTKSINQLLLINIFIEEGNLIPHESFMIGARHVKIDEKYFIKRFPSSIENHFTVKSRREKATKVSIEIGAEFSSSGGKAHFRFSFCSEQSFLRRLISSFFVRFN